ncbi:unnamed protein product [Phytophthora fragariaefolia]|uniref:Unnamed protein product n=1 Tax=Phytophthora fragariaefolia TaxID=1490495 RepID=A0A9W6TWF0_9STRA|nr:unnamed protein product [Phytophthora fragariaefolia]
MAPPRGPSSLGGIAASHQARTGSTDLSVSSQPPTRLSGGIGSGSSEGVSALDGSRLSQPSEIGSISAAGEVIDMDAGTSGKFVEWVSLRTTHITPHWGSATVFSPSSFARKVSQRSRV